jgi:GNAT superfamily N-acetyltransferase
MNNFSIRFATEDDCGLILHFIKGIAEYEKLSDQVVATEDKIRTHLFGEKAVAECFLAFEDDTPVGFALFSFRGKGYGKKLLMHLVQTARERDCGRVEWSVLDWNTPAIDFYKSLGAVAMDGWTVFRITL